MNNNLLQAVNFLVDKKKVEADVVFDALEMVLLTAYKKEMGSNAKTSISLDRTTGEYKIYEEKIFRPAILTTVNSLGEMIAKTNYIRSKNEDISIICVPCGVEKSKIVKASKAILVDDYSGNLANWVKSGGIGIKFGYDKDYVSIDSLASFVSGEVVKKLALVC